MVQENVEIFGGGDQTVEELYAWLRDLWVIAGFCNLVSINCPLPF